ncbi:ABC transporter ATP-binding protein [Leekyejoonella antrihumi]|uniref:Phosphate ABC transporter ATP-binding protein n=1 Tax=Leekyejoonella antrihumi TaxID=1660198 RepID=A0A563E1J4_9MICO|nr:phosphate ABC transporter ATP-binding protein [Leekyejoonella antrihumi]TWP36386.1 phosphate ABC transporter ATP-binding protein [Leekyejoonella antrihumi]
MDGRDVVVDQVVVHRNGRLILDGVSAAFRPGAITAVCGPSGSGKTSLLRLINRLDVPTSGAVRYGGVDVAGLDVRELRRRVGMIFQRPTPFPGTVRANLRQGAERSDTDYARVLEQVALTASMLDRDTADLSGGELQRVCLARTLTTEPEALLMDEPTSSLDPDAARVVEDAARALAGAGMTIVWVTHDLQQRDRIADDVFAVGDAQ